MGDEQLAQAVVATLVKKGIKLLALDFDKTIISIHTAGYWRQGAHSLVEHVRPCFISLIKAALQLQSNQLQVCVVTYSTQPGLISDVLRMILPKGDAARIFIRGNTKDWSPSEGAGQPLGKQQHLAWVCTEIFNHRHIIIAAHEIVLFDDDSENCEVALEFGHQAYEVPEDVMLEHIKDYTDKLSIKPPKTSMIRS